MGVGLLDAADAGLRIFRGRRGSEDSVKRRKFPLFIV